jgi:hypothetical protein
MGSSLERQSADLAQAHRKGAIGVVLISLVGIFVAASAIGTRAVAERSQRELQRLPLTEFYDTPRPLPPAEPGELIRAMPFEDYNLPPEVEAVRFLYHSRAAAGADVAASGVVLFPDREPPAQGWPIIAWAHEFSGVARQCAPSLLRNPEHGPFLTIYVGLGYAVVVSDYAGLGTDFPNAAADIPSEPSDVIYSVPAARRAVRGLGSPWLSMATGEGALASIGVAEDEGEISDPACLEASRFPALRSSTTLTRWTVPPTVARWSSPTPSSASTRTFTNVTFSAGKACPPIPGWAPNAAEPNLREVPPRAC